MLPPLVPAKAEGLACSNRKTYIYVKMNEAQVTEVLRIATAIGIPADLFERWAGYELALYQDTGGRGSSLAMAQRDSERRIALGGWTLDLGNRAVGLPGEQGALLRDRLVAAGIPFATGSQSIAYIKRIHAVSNAHEDVLRELAKR
jgi:hypothetical protein